MRTSYSEKDVVLLLKDVTGLVKPQPAKERERLIQAGRHYCEMLPMEYIPTKEYMDTYEDALENYGGPTARAVGCVSCKIMEEKGRDVVLVSLARAGIPVGILIKRYIKWKYKVDVPHYSISIIRGRGIDDCAIKYILKRHKAEQVLFVDGWIGKGAILGELEREVGKYPGLSGELAVLADPANVTDLCGTHEDILIPSSCLNSTVSGLISRTFLRDDIIGENEFHGALYYEEWKEQDLSYDFIEAIQSRFQMDSGTEEMAEPVGSGNRDLAEPGGGTREVRRIAEAFSIDNMNLVKPGIGETTRVLLRRVPWKVLISTRHRSDPSLNHIKRLAEEKNVPIEYRDLDHYKACGIIKNMADT